MDDQALVEGSGVFKDEDDPAEESQLVERGTEPGKLQGCSMPQTGVESIWIKDGARDSSFLPSYFLLPWLRTGISFVIPERVLRLKEPGSPSSTGHWRGCSCCS